MSEDGYQFHFPGQEFTGPGTHIVSKLQQHILPRNKTDFATMLHDVDYLINNSDNPIVSDFNSMLNSDWTIPGLVTKFGLGVKATSSALYGTPSFNNPLSGKTAKETRDIGLKLKDYISNDRKYSKLFQQYGIDKANWYQSTK